MKLYFLLLVFWPNFFLGIVESQIETKNIYLYNYDTYKLEEMLFTIKKIKKIDIYEQKWSNNLQFDRKPHSNSVELIEKDLKIWGVKKIWKFFWAGGWAF